ncbi:MAG: hypothetical protein VYA80_02660 [Pseudomonadota bacterium]|nr:hypothetical protein [Pseudomonadota bacterium]
MISRTNISVLLATLLLGILLWTVLGIVNKFEEIPTSIQEKGNILSPVITNSIILNQNQLEKILATLTEDIELRIEGYRNWMLAHGFPDNYVFWSAETNDFESEYKTRNNLDLISLAGDGDVDAMHALAKKSLYDAPLNSLSWYDQAIAHGSIFAMLKTSDLLEIIADSNIQKIFDNAGWKSANNLLAQQKISPGEKALAWSITAITLGGYTIMNTRHAGRLKRLKSKLSPEEIKNACDVAETFLIESVQAIRNNSKAILAFDQPPIALTTPNPKKNIPCDNWMSPLIEFSNCNSHPVLSANNQAASLWICPYTHNQ